MTEDIEIIAVFCPVCDWAITKTQAEQIRVSIECPGCGCRQFPEEFGSLVNREPPDPADWWKNG